MNTRTIILAAALCACSTLSGGFHAAAMTPVVPIAFTYMEHPGPLGAEDIERLELNKFVLLTEEELSQSTIMVEATENYIQSNLLVFKITTPSGAVHHYLGSYIGKFYADGAFLGHDGDVNMLRFHPKREIMFDGDDQLEISVSETTATVTRRYITDVNQRGAICNDNCVVTDVYKIDDKGIIRFDHHDESDTHTEGPAAIVGKAERRTYNRDKCDIDRIALEIMDLSHLPMSDSGYVEKWDKLTDAIINIVFDTDDEFPEGMTDDPDYYAEWLTRVVERDPANAMTWIYEHEKTSTIDELLLGGVVNEGDECLQRFVKHVLTLDDATAKKWWTKWLEDCKELIAENAEE